MQLSSSMGDGTYDHDKSPEKRRFEVILPDFPGQDFLAHAGQQWLEQAEARLAQAHLLSVARGGEPRAIKTIIDTPMLPELDPSDREFSRRVEYNMKAQTQNQSNYEKKYI